jgi:pyruvate dehydrogenase E2 component (dihydrolipoamide acetyltransferase)
MPRYLKPDRISAWRQLSVGMWGAHTSPQAQGTREVDMTKTLPWLAKLSQKHGVKCTITHLWVAAVGRVLAQHPETNVILRRNRPYQRQTVDVFVQVAITGGGRADLSGIKIRDVDSASVPAIAELTAKRAAQVRGGEDQEAERAKSTLTRIPAVLMPLALRAMSFLNYDVGLDLSWLGVDADPFGSAMVTNVGSFGIRMGLAPLAPMSRVPILFALGAIHDRALVVDGKVEARPVMIASGSFDHRLLDGYQIGYLTAEVCTMAANPEDYDLGDWC